MCLCPQAEWLYCTQTGRVTTGCAGVVSVSFYTLLSSQAAVLLNFLLVTLVRSGGNQPVVSVASSIVVK